MAFRWKVALGCLIAFIVLSLLGVDRSITGAIAGVMAVGQGQA
jgi:hypothetical protein